MIALVLPVYSYSLVTIHMELTVMMLTAWPMLFLSVVMTEPPDMFAKSW